MVTELYRASDGREFEAYRDAFDYENMLNYNSFTKGWSENFKGEILEKDTYEMNYEYFRDFFGDMLD